VDIGIEINGGVCHDKLELPGVANMLANVLPQGTKNKTPEELEEEIELLGSDIKMSAGPEKSRIYFVDIPGSRQSVIYIGYLAMSRDNPDFVKLDFVNYHLGGAFTSILNQILREEKGFTYGAFSYIMGKKVLALFISSTSLRSDATFESLQIFRNEMLQFIKECMMRLTALRFEINNALVGMLSSISKYGLADDYIKRDEEVIKNMTIEEHKAITDKYIIPDKMYYVIVRDAATQLNQLEKLGFGKPIVVKL
jgi:zinc protease